MKKRSISIVIPAFNEAEYIAACLNSIAGQTIMPDEVIIVDNNSIDQTVKIAEQYPFATVLTEPRQGVRFAYRTGMDAARGEIIGRIDADTVLSPDWCERLEILFDEPTTAAVTGACWYYDMPFQRLSLRLDRRARRYAHAADDALLYGCNMAIRASAWKSISGEVCMQPGIFEDCDMTIHLLRKNAVIAYDPQLVAGISARTLDMSYRNFYRYLSNNTRTFALHAMRSKSARRAKLVYMTTYPFLKVIRRLYNPVTGRFSLMQLLSERAEARLDATR